MIDSKIAFTVEDYFTDEARLDPTHIKTIVRMSGKNNGQKFSRILKYHKCTQSDLSHFPEVSIQSKYEYEQIVNDDKRGL